MHLEQVQDFTPTPMTVATEIYYSGYHPYTGEKIFTAIRPEEKLAQRKYFFWYDKTYRDDIIRSLHRLHRPDLVERLYPGRPYTPRVAHPAPQKSRNKSINTKNKYEHNQDSHHDSHRNAAGGNKRRRR